MNNTKLVEALTKVKEIKAPEWASFVKTGNNKERPPVQDDWWILRSASLLRKVRKFGPIGANRLSKQYGGRKNRGHKPDRKVPASRKVIRVGLSQLESAGLIRHVSQPKAGKIITKEGIELLEKSN